MVSLKQIRWGSYLDWSGPWFPGDCKFTMPSSPTDEDVWLATLTATEGGAFNAINMYDRCILSVGLIQWCEMGQYSVSDLTGAIVASGGAEVRPFLQFLDSLGVYFQQNAKGRWRFHFLDSRGEVSDATEQKQLFLLTATGKTDSWGEEDSIARLYAKNWAMAYANLLAGESARKVQVQFIRPRLLGFVLPSVKLSLYSPGTSYWPQESPWTKVVQAAFLSYAGNNPTWAEQAYKRWETTKSGDPERDCIELLKELTFGPKVAIYPGRYDKIRPVLEGAYGVDLPDFHAELKAWQVVQGIDPSIRRDRRVETTEDVQRALLQLGYDLGPSGADGRFGPKTKQAVLFFQASSGLTVDGDVGPKTRSALEQRLSLIIAG